MKWNFFLVGVALTAILGFVVYGYQHHSELVVLNPQGSVGVEEQKIMALTVLLAGIVVIPLFALLATFLWKYRIHNPHAARKHKPDWDHDNWIAEALWWLIPTIIIAILSVVIWRSSHELDPYKPIEGRGTPLTVEVVSLNWKWLFIYPELGIATVNKLEIPTGRPIHFILTSDAPMNSFWIPSLGGQIMAMPGMKTELYLLAEKSGVFEGVSANISGAGFSGMKFNTIAVLPGEFDAWVTKVKHGTTQLTKEEYELLTQPSENVSPHEYAEVTINLFDRIVGSTMMPEINMSPQEMKNMHAVEPDPDMQMMQMNEPIKMPKNIDSNASSTQSRPTKPFPI